MDLNDLQLALPTSNDSNAIFTFHSPRPQHFKFRSPIINYIFSKQCSGYAWKKLIMSCKYFFSKNSVYPVEYLTYADDGWDGEWDADGEIFNSTTNIAKLWIYDEINAHFDLKSLIPKIIKCDLRSLKIFHQNLTFDEYQFLISSGDVKKLRIHRCTIKHSDGNLVTFDQLFINISKLEEFSMKCASNSFSMFEKDTFKKVAQFVPHLKKLSYFDLSGLTEVFDFSTIDDFLLKNENLLIRLEFDFLSDGYNGILASFITKIIEAPPKQIPLIEFPGFGSSDIYNDYLKIYFSRK